MEPLRARHAPRWTDRSGPGAGQPAHDPAKQRRSTGASARVRYWPRDLLRIRNSATRKADGTARALASDVKRQPLGTDAGADTAPADVEPHAREQPHRLPEPQPHALVIACWERLASADLTARPGTPASPRRSRSPRPRAGTCPRRRGRRVLPPPRSCCVRRAGPRPARGRWRGRGSTRRRRAR